MNFYKFLFYKHFLTLNFYKLFNYTKKKIQKYSKLKLKIHKYSIINLNSNKLL